MATWPSYAKIMFNGYSEKPESAVVVTPMDDGPSKTRRVKSRVMVKRAVNAHLASKADYVAFLAWFRDAAGADRGAAWFDWIDPLDGTTKQARIAGGLIDDARPMRLGLNSWMVSLTLETWDA